jgi:hypothetical protein
MDEADVMEMPSAFTATSAAQSDAAWTDPAAPAVSQPPASTPRATALNDRT